MSDPILEFHHHLDECKQCYSKPFELCSTGAKLLSEAANSVDDGIDFLLSRGINPAKKRLPETSTLSGKSSERS